VTGFHLKFPIAAIIGLGLVQLPLSSAPLLWVQSPIEAPGNTVPVAVNYTTDTNAPSLQFDLVYATNYLSSGTPVGGNALSDHQVASAEPSPGVRRVLIFSFSNSPITNGVLVFVPFTAATNSPDHDELLTLTNVVIASTNADQVPANATGGTLAIAVPPRFISIAPTNGGAMHLQLSGTPGRNYVISASTNLNAPSWIGLETNVATAGVLDFEDPSASSFSSRFYRASVPQ
jgi:hypothetical protein